MTQKKVPVVYPDDKEKQKKFEQNHEQGSLPPNEIDKMTMEQIYGYADIHNYEHQRSSKKQELVKDVSEAVKIEEKKDLDNDVSNAVASGSSTVGGQSDTLGGADGKDTDDKPQETLGDADKPLTDSKGNEVDMNNPAGAGTNVQKSATYSNYLNSVDEPSVPTDPDDDLTGEAASGVPASDVKVGDAERGMTPGDKKAGTGSAVAVKAAKKQEDAEFERKNKLPGGYSQLDRTTKEKKVDFKKLKVDKKIKHLRSELDIMENTSRSNHAVTDDFRTAISGGRQWLGSLLGDLKKGEDPYPTADTVNKIPERTDIGDSDTKAARKREMMNLGRLDGVNKMREELTDIIDKVESIEVGKDFEDERQAKISKTNTYTKLNEARFSLGESLNTMRR